MNEILFQTLRIALIIGAVGLVFKLAARYLPTKKLSSNSSQTVIVLRDKIVYYIAWLLALAISIGFFYLMVRLVPHIQDNLFIGDRPDAVYVLHANMLSPDSLMPLSIGYIALMGIGIIAIFLTKLYLKLAYRTINVEEKLELLSKTGTRGVAQQINSLGLLRRLNYIIIPPALIILLLSINTYTIVTDSRIIDNSPLSFTEKSYAYDDISKILFLPNFKDRISGKVESMHPRYAIIMKDGSQWVTHNLEAYRNKLEVEVFTYISTQSGIPIKEGVRNIDDKP